jgi:hypothetical protein
MSHEAIRHIQQAARPLVCAPPASYGRWPHGVMVQRAGEKGGGGDAAGAPGGVGAERWAADDDDEEEEEEEEEKEKEEKDVCPE